MSWQTDWKVEKGVKIPDFRSQTGKHKELDDFLQSLEIGDSFVIHPKIEGDGSIKSHTGANIVTRGRRIGIKLTSRKIYSDESPDKYYWRIWFTEKIEPQIRKMQHQRPAAEVTEKSFNDLAQGRLPHDILFLAEQNEENKAIVEDIRRLNRILVEELTKQNIKLPEGE
jgi:hypothetical protein